MSAEGVSTAEASTPFFTSFPSRWGPSAAAGLGKGFVSEKGESPNAAKDGSAEKGESVKDSETAGPCAGTVEFGVELKADGSGCRGAGAVGNDVTATSGAGTTEEIFGSPGKAEKNWLANWAITETSGTKAGLGAPVLFVVVMVLAHVDVFQNPHRVLG